MTLPLNRDILRAAYDFLCETPPFSKWNLPDGDDVKFKVVRSGAYRGWHTFDGKQHVIAISAGAVGHTRSLMEVMAHEMVHVHNHHSGAFRGSEHGAAFYRWAAVVCRVHGFDPKTF